MDIKELYEDVKNLKTNIYNNDREFMIKEVYSKYSSNEDFLEIFDMIVRDVDKILDKLKFETKLELQKQEKKCKFYKEVFK